MGQADPGPYAPRPLGLNLASGGNRVPICNSLWKKTICRPVLSRGFFCAQELPGRTVVPSQQLLSCGFAFPLVGASGHGSGP